MRNSRKCAEAPEPGALRFGFGRPPRDGERSAFSPQPNFAQMRQFRTKLMQFLHDEAPLIRSTERDDR